MAKQEKKSGLWSSLLGAVGLELRSNPTEKRSSLENPQTPLSYPAEWLLDIFNGGRTDSGLRVSEMTALQVVTVFQCVNIIANGIAAHPLNVYRRINTPDGPVGKEIAYDHPLYDILNTEPNPEMTSATWRRTMQCHKLLWGNAFSEIERDNSNRISAVWPRNPARTRPVRLLSPMTYQGDLLPAGTLMYETFEAMKDSQIMEQDSLNQHAGFRRLVLAEDMLHFVGLSLDGRLGSDVIVLSRQAIGLSLAAEKYGAKFFGNGAVPQGILGVPGDMTEIQWETLKRSWMEAHGGENQHRTGVLPPGVTYTKTASTPEEGQMIQTRQHQKSEIAGIFNVPGHMIGINGDDAGKSTVEQSSIEFKLFCLDPHAVDWTQELNRKLFHKIGQSANKFFCGFDMRKLMYPDAASRATLYGSGKQWGYLNTDAIHELEDMNPVKDGSGQKYWMPTNMQDAGAASQAADAVQSGLDDGTLAATPAGVTPIGTHPIIKAQQKAQQAQNDHELEKHKISASASVKIAKAGGATTDDTDETPGKKSKGKVAPKKKSKREDLTRVFSGIFRDACGRAAHRNKPAVGDYLTIFGSITSAMIEAAYEEPVDGAGFIRDHIQDVYTRMKSGWGADIDATAKQEFERLLTALMGA